MVDDTPECLSHLHRTRAYLTGQEHRARYRRAEVSYNMLPEWPRVVYVVKEMLALIAAVRLGNIRVPPSAISKTRAGEARRSHGPGSCTTKSICCAT